MANGRVKKKCDGCGRMVNELTFYHGKFLCWRCRPYGIRKPK